MEPQQHVQFHDCQKVRRLLIVFVCLSLGLQVSSSSCEVPIREVAPSSKNMTGSTFCSFKKFMMKSYFEKYDSFLESHFQAFIAEEILSSCKPLTDNENLLLRLSVPHRHLIGEGSHRHMSSIIRLNFQPESLSELPNHFCKVIIIEKLPCGVFADPFELQHLIKRGALTDVSVFGDTNLELPSFLSNRSVIEIHMNIGPDILSGNVNQIEIKVDIPVHARYQPLDDSGYTEVEFGAPDLFVHCSIDENSNNSSYLYRPTVNVSESNSGAVVWRIPSGKRAHATIVSSVTFLAAFMSTFLIISSSIFYSHFELCKSLKQS